jgi:hypothetical protein
MKYNKILALVPALLLAACGGDEQTVHEKATPGSLVYSYPANHQIGISPKADVVLRFSDAITEDESELQSKIKLATGGTNVPFTVTKIDGGKSLELSTGSKLAPGATYSVTFSDPLLAEGNRAIEMPETLGENGVQFTTRGSFSGVAELADITDEFSVAWQVPASDDQTNARFQAMNFSTFRLAMTQPVHPDWKKLGGTIELLDQNDQPVPATVLVKGNRITVDPCVTEQPEQCGSKDDVLNSGETYTLKLTNLASLTDASENNRFTGEFSYTPRDTGPTVVLKQSAVDSGLAAGETEDEATHSILNGQIINGVTLNSVLQGKAGPSQQTGDLYAELAFAPAFDASEPLPLRIAKGSILRSTSLDVLVGGVVPVTEAVRPGEPTGDLQTTGDIKVTMLSDATGYMSPNAYTDDINAPRQITLFMDVSMNTGEAQPNAALSQDLMGVELRGIALVKDGVLTIDAIGMVEPNLLGQEYTDSTIAFHLEAATDADSALDAEQERQRGLDTTGPSLVSWMPGATDAIPATRQSMQRPGDPVILFFDEPLDPKSIESGVTLSEGGTPVTDLTTRLDGTALILNPEGGLKHGVEYTVTANGLKDLAGNPATIAQAPLTFTLDPIGDSSVPKGPPLALTTYPGFPCETDFALLDLNNGVLGKCYSAGGKGDVLPVAKLPSNRPITVVFSKSMDLDSIIAGQTFKVEKVTQKSDGTVTVLQDPVEGRLEKNNQRIRFFPDKPWEPGAHYRYTLASTEDAGTCSAGSYSSICDTDGLALKTDLLEGINDSNNGPDNMVIYFTGEEEVNTVFTPLRNLPIRDTNSNFRIDCSSNDNANCLEPFDHDYRDPAEVVDANAVSSWLPSANSTKLSVVNNKAGAFDARVGCETGDSCPKNKFIYQTYGLNTEVVGPGTYEGQDAVLVNLYPTMLATTSASVFVNVIGLQEESITNTQVIRMRYAEDPSCQGQANCRRNQLIPGAIVQGDDGQPVFKTKAELMLDAPDMEIPLGGTHDLYGREFVFDLEGDITFFDDGRMQIEQRNKNVVNITVTAKVLAGAVTITLPLQIPIEGTYLNFISNPVKDLPAEQ